MRSPAVDVYPHRARKSDLNKTPLRARKCGSKVSRLNTPLSELAKGYNHIPKCSTGGWVNRSIEVRMKEVLKRNGHIPRPANSFILYRKAYLDIAKVWRGSKNQRISSIITESWRMETLEVRKRRKRYNRYAQIEKHNHKKAYPQYKYSPRKSQEEAPKMSEDGKSSDLDDLNFDRRASYQWQPKARSSERQSGKAAYPVQSGLGKPLPAILTEQIMSKQFFQATDYSSHEPDIEDNHMHETENLSAYNNNTPSLLSLFSENDHELLDTRSLNYSVGMVNKNQVDPLLLTLNIAFTSQPNDVFSEPPFTESIDFHAERRLWHYNDAWGKISHF